MSRNPRSFKTRRHVNQYNLGNAYKQRIRGDNNENLQKADECYLAAMEVYKRYRDPEEE
ncbi:hypothetical protein [Calothrix sp. CCY 0018]|uniref:hypothetical protein n=1 Tax=Calothrix sp. CCY 0018 TaxID=3103864 RepID=UPI0039C750EE